MRPLLSVLLLLPALVLVPPASAEAENSVFLPTTMSVSSCGGETIELTGTLHLIYSVTNNSNSDHVRSYSQLRGLTGVGPSTGQYHASGITTESTNVDGEGFPFSYTYRNNFRLVGQGPGNNFQVHLGVHVTINANGDVTADISNIEAECK